MSAGPETLNDDVAPEDSASRTPAGGAATAATPTAARQWRLYRAWGFAPPSAGLRAHLIDFLLGPQLHLLYIGITARTGPDRWLEHLGFGTGAFRRPPRKCAPYVVLWEVDTSRTYPTEDAALQAEAEAIHAEQPIDNIAGKGRTGRPRPGGSRTRRYRPVRQRLFAAKVALLAGVVAFSALALPRIVTGDFPRTWAQTGVWALTGVVGWLLLRRWVRHHTR